MHISPFSRLLKAGLSASLAVVSLLSLDSCVVAPPPGGPGAVAMESDYGPGPGPSNYRSGPSDDYGPGPEVGPGPGGPMMDEEEDGGPPVEVLPMGSQVTYVDGVQLWVHNGVYYRRHGHHGWVIYHPHRRVVVRGGPVYATEHISVLPVGARVVYYHGERVWLHHGVYYRRHPHGGWVVIH